MNPKSFDKRDYKRIKQKIKDANPVQAYMKDDALVIQKAEGKQLEELANEDHVMLVSIDGDDITVNKAKKDADDLVLEYDGKQCAITSKPIVTDGLQWYFTKPGFLGTMALNKDTLLSGDLYNPSTSTYERKLDADNFSKEDFERHGIDEDQYKLKERDNGDEYYRLNQQVQGEVNALLGSKKTLKTMNEGKRLRKLLQPSSKDLKTIAIYVALGVGIGYGSHQYI